MAPPAHRLNFPSLSGAEARVSIEFKAGELVHDFFNGDVKLALRSIAVAELNDQIALGNTQFILRVDGSQNKSILQADKKVDVNFINESFAFAFQYIFQLLYRVAYDRSYGVAIRSGRLGTNVRAYLNGYPVSVASIKTFGPNDKLAFWYMEPYAHRISRLVRLKHGISMVRRAKRILSRDPRFRGLYFRALDMPADLGDGYGRIRRVGVSVRISSRAQIINPGSAGAFAP